MRTFVAWLPGKRKLVVLKSESWAGVSAEVRDVLRRHKAKNAEVYETSRKMKY